MAPTRVGIIGASWGAHVQAPAFRTAEGYELVALCSDNEMQLARAAQRLGLTDTCIDWRAFVRRDDLDLISVAAPVAWHKPMTLAAIAAGKAVLCEKPLAMSAADGAEMLAAAEQAGIAHAVGFEFRWSPERLSALAAVRGGLVGQPYSLRMFQSADFWHPTHAPQSEWMYKRASGGGYLAAMLSHDIDFACQLLGEPLAVAGEVHTSVPRLPMSDGREIQVDADDTSAALIRFVGGASALLSACVVGAHAAGLRMDLFGSDGTLILESGPEGPRLLGGAATADGLAALALDRREPRGGPVVSGGRNARAIRATALMLEEWRDHRANPEPVVPTFRAGLRTQRVIDAVRRSAGGAGWVDVR